jgi:hypothetical protein
MLGSWMNIACCAKAWQILNELATP